MMQRRSRMKAVVIAVLLGVVGALAKMENCSSGQYTTKGECCKQCPPSEGVIKACGATQTVCAQCLDSETFSENFSHQEKCQPCRQCTGLYRMEAPCSDSNDATCVCNYGYYHNVDSQQCEPCTRCPEGHGMLYSCGADQDTVCEECTMDTYSDQESSRDPCIPCTICDDDVVIQPCTSVSDTVCQGRVSPTPYTGSSDVNYDDFWTPSSSELGPEAPTENIPTAAEADHPDQIYKGFNEELIPIYCSILAAVVVSVVAFFIFKKWNSCKQNKQGVNNCTANHNQTPSPEGEKLHSDSGISVDSQSLQDHLSQTKSQTVVSIDEEPCLLLPLHTREKVEKLLYSGSEGDNCNHIQDSDWYNLAGLLGYDEERIVTFQHEEHPVRALLSDWARKDCASIDALCTALRKINRDDVAQSLVVSPTAPKPTATSVV